MTQDEAEKIAAVIRTADHGCSACVGDLVDRLNAAGLGFTFEVFGELEMVEQPAWSDDPDDAETRTYPHVVATAVPPDP